MSDRVYLVVTKTFGDSEAFEAFSTREKADAYVAWIHGPEWVTKGGIPVAEMWAEVLEMPLDPSPDLTLGAFVCWVELRPKPRPAYQSHPSESSTMESMWAAGKIATTWNHRAIAKPVRCWRIQPPAALLDRWAPVLGLPAGDSWRGHFNLIRIEGSAQSKEDAERDVANMLRGVLDGSVVPEESP